MELPTALRRAIDRELDGVSLNDLSAAALALSECYRSEQLDSKLRIVTRQDALAYVATRLPATYAAVRAAFSATAERLPDFAPRTLLDIGSGPGTALWAAAECWPAVAEALLVEASPVFVTLGTALAAEATLPRHQWRRADIAVDGIDAGPHDLVTATYVLNELGPQVRTRTIERLWAATSGVMIIVEPGTPAGWRRIIDARALLIAAGGHVVAPCPHDQACPLRAPDWCHFAERVARSRQHRLAKGADVPWEDEKFSYVAVSRSPPANPASRIIARPRKAGGHVTLKLCKPDGNAQAEVFSRRDGDAFKRTRRRDWGDTF